VRDLRRDHRRRLLLQGDDGLGGAAGVGRAVNQAVVISFLGVFAFNYIFTAVLLATNPELQTIR
jgi:phospholipid/cholesterol/gamma-HCH transport system permease protein